MRIRHTRIRVHPFGRTDYSYEVDVSIIEIYNNNISDLLLDRRVRACAASQSGRAIETAGHDDQHD